MNGVHGRECQCNCSVFMRVKPHVLPLLLLQQPLTDLDYNYVIAYYSIVCLSFWMSMNAAVFCHADHFKGPACPNVKIIIRKWMNMDLTQMMRVCVQPTLNIRLHLSLNFINKGKVAIKIKCHPKSLIDKIVAICLFLNQFPAVCWASQHDKINYANIWTLHMSNDRIYVVFLLMNQVPPIRTNPHTVTTILHLPKKK